jgi:hypothetical protein
MQIVRNKKFEKEIEQIIKDQELNCSIAEFKDKVDWNYISEYQKLSEVFITKFKDKVNWTNISSCQKLSEVFITKFKDKVNWDNISRYQKLSEVFITEFKDKANWNYISECQKLSEDFITEFKDKVNWNWISCSQKLSEEFITEFKDKVDWEYISCHQKLSEVFITKFKDKVNIKTYRQINEEKSVERKTKEIKEYAKTNNLKFDSEYLYAFREHDEYGRGIFNKTISYEKGKYYKDWHCDMRKDIENSFGLGIWPRGNTPIKVKVEDWGVAVNRDDGKARVWGFEMV